jgi:hypothetical protein
MLTKIKQMISLLPYRLGQILKFGCLIGLRPSEILDSVRLINGDKQVFQA